MGEKKNPVGGDQNLDTSQMLFLTMIRKRGQIERRTSQ
jgi:hypothetical protein